ATASAMSRKSRPATNSTTSLNGALLGRAALVLFARELVHRRVLHDLLAGDLPGFLDDPGQRPILTSRLVLDLLQHLLWKVQALLALVGTAHEMTKPPRVVQVRQSSVRRDC